MNHNSVVIANPTMNIRETCINVHESCFHDEEYCEQCLIFVMNDVLVK